MASILRRFLIFAFLCLSSIAYSEEEIPKQPEQAPEQVQEMQQDEQAAKNSYLINEQEEDGTGGGLFVAYSRNIEKKSNHMAFGGQFYFLFNDAFRLGLQGAFIKAFQKDGDQGFFIGPMGEYALRFDPFVLNFGLTPSYASWANVGYFGLLPQVGIELRFTKSISFSLKGAYLMLFNDDSIQNKSFFKISQPLVGFYVNFGAF